MNERPFSWEEALSACGYPGSVPIHALERHGVFRWDGLVLKIARLPDERLKLRVEAVANEAFQGAAEGVRIPRSTYHERAEFGILEAEDLGGVPYAETVAGGPIRTIPPSAYAAAAGFIQRLRNVPMDEAPPLLLEQARTGLNDQALRARLDGYLTNAVTKGVLPEAMVTALLHFYDRLPMERGLNHHDVAPWNWLALEDGGLGQIDPEFARWGFKNYDVVYFPTQWAISADYPEEVGRWWEAYMALGEDPGVLIQGSLKPLVYRLGAIASDLAQAEDVQIRVREAVGALLRHDGAALSRSLGLRS
jgi:hypothetical protein